MSSDQKPPQSFPGAISIPNPEMLPKTAGPLSGPIRLSGGGGLEHGLRADDGLAPGAIKLSGPGLAGGGATGAPPGAIKLSGPSLGASSGQAPVNLGPDAIKLSGPGLAAGASQTPAGLGPDAIKLGGPVKQPAAKESADVSRLLGHPGLIKLGGPGIAPENPLEGNPSVPNPEALRALQAKGSMPQIHYNAPTPDTSQNLPDHIQNRLKNMEH